MTSTSPVPESHVDEAQTPHRGAVASKAAIAAGWVQSARFTPVLMGAVLLFATSLILHGISRGEFNINIDEAIDATTGLYFADFYRDLPLRHPVQYTYEYYAQYPALGLFHWPPLFHAVEGGMFLLFGSSVVVARITVLLFTLFGLFFWFRLVNEIDNQWTAAISTFVLAGLPALLLYEKAVMLEVPSLALCMAAIFYWVRYLKTEQNRYTYLFAVFAALALLTKQQSIFLAPLALLATIACRKWRLVLSRNTLKSLTICVLLILPFYMTSLDVDAGSIKGNLRMGLRHISDPFTYYPAALPKSLGMLFLALGYSGIATWIWWRRRESPPIMLAWIVGWYVTFTFIATKDTRYIVYWIPPFIYFAVAPFTSKVVPRLLRPAAFTVVAAILVLTAYTGWTYERPYVSGYRQVAKQMLESQKEGVVLFDGRLAGNFIFFMRAYDPARRFVVLRKALYVTDVMPQFGQEELIHSKADLALLLKQYGIKYVVIESSPPIRFASPKLLREFLQTDEFKLVERVPIESNAPEWKGQNLLVYENLNAGPPTEHILRLRMLSMSHDIVVSLDKYFKR